MAAEPNSRQESAHEEHEAGSENEKFDRDELFHLLQNERRRRALDYLRGKEGPVRMRDIVDHVAAAEHGTSPEALRSNERKRVHIALYQSHLPKLDQAGVIDYDQDRGIVVRTDRAKELDQFLAIDAESSEPQDAVSDAAYPGAVLADEATSDDLWYRYYLALTTLSALALVVSTVVGASLVTPMTIAVVVVVAFGGLSTVHWARSRDLV